MVDKAIGLDSMLRIRPARGSDSVAMISVINSAFNVEDFLEGTRTDEARLSELMEQGEFLVAEDRRDKIVATVYLEFFGERGYFGMLAVDPPYQRGGLGRRMIQAAEERARQRGCAYMDIKVLSLRAELLPFYEKLGYRQKGAEPFRPSRPLKPGVECYAIAMSKRL
jgi:GNAT superfamily N-acetyltransferase